MKQRHGLLWGLIFCLCLCLALPFSSAQAVTWEYGTSGQSQNPFTPRGYVIETENGWFWLNSRFDNSSGSVVYSGEKNGVDFIEAQKADGSNYTLYALTDRNPKVYQYLAAYKNGQPIENFSQYIQAPGRLSGNQNLGSGANWAIPIEGFEFEPGCYYEFAFLRGLQANNGITLVFSEDGKGYIQNPETEAEIAKYEADKYEEYQFMSSYWVEWNADHSDYTYDFHLVPMRFSVQTYADLSAWETGRQTAVDFLSSVTAADISSGKYVQKNIDSLESTLAKLDERAETSVRKMLQDDADTTIKLMISELQIALSKAQKPKTAGADLEELKKQIKEGEVLYEEASGKIGTGIGQYDGDLTAALKVSLEHAKTMTKANAQSEVDAAARDLAEAITRVYASVIHEPSLILYDYATKIKLVIPETAVPADTVLYVHGFTSEEEEYQAASAALAEVLQQEGENPKELVLYQIQLYSGDLITHPSQKFRVQIPVPGGSWESNVYYSADGTDYQLLPADQADGVKMMRVEDTGYFAIVYNPEAEETPPPPEEPTNPVTSVEETSVELDETPDETTEDIAETAGEEEKTDDAPYEEPRTATTPVAADSAWQEQGVLLHDASALSVLWLSGLAVLAAAILAIFALLQNRRGGKALPPKS